MKDIEKHATEILEVIYSELEERGYGMGFCDKGNTIEGAKGYMSYTTFFSIMDELQKEKELGVPWQIENPKVGMGYTRSSCRGRMREYTSKGNLMHCLNGRDCEETCIFSDKNFRGE